MQKDRDLGVIESKLTNGMWKTSTGDVVPAFPNLKIGDKVTIKNKNYDFGDKKQSQSIDPVSKQDERLSALEEQNKNLLEMLKLAEDRKGATRAN